MKKILKSLMILSLAAFVSTACTDSTEYDSIDPRPTSDLLYPTSGSTVELFKYSEAKTNFEWKKAEGTQMYSVVFYDAGKQELATFLADNNGERNSLQLPHAQLSVLAERAGVAAGKSGDLYWNVITSAGSHSMIAAKASKLTVTRYKSAMEKPYQLFLTGEGTEGGADFTKALPMKKIGDKFEIYTMLNGKYQFVNRNEEGNKMAIGRNEEGEMTYGADAFGEAAKGVYRVTIDFLSSEISLEKVTSLKMLLANGNLIQEFAYVGNGAWKLPQQITIEWANGDDRYRFVAEVDGKKELWSSTRTNRDAESPRSILAADGYYNLNVDTNTEHINDSYQCAFKFYDRIANAHSDKADVYVYMQPARFYHEFKLTYSLTDVPAVSTLTTPAAGIKLMLSTTKDASAEFKWVAPGACPQLKLTSYKVIFTKDAAGQQVIGEAAANWDTHVNIRHTDLDAIAAEAGIASATSGTVYWTVRTTVEGTAKLASCPARKLIIRRFIALPTEAYVTGAGTEFAAEYGKMHVITDEGEHKGKFEVYVKLTKDGKYDLTTSKDPNGDSYAKYAVTSLKTGGKIEENAAADNKVTKESGVYRLIVDFNVDTIGIYKVDNMRFVSLVVRDQPIALDYIGNGVWGKTNVIPVFRGGWDDDRMNFFAEYDGVKLKLGSNEKNAGEIATEPKPGDPKYWIYFTGEMSDWDYYLHCLKSYRANTDKKANIQIHMNGNQTCTHPFTYIEYLTK
ncbi:MAG: SusE domain-containing protein [Alistipes sp.]